MEKKNPQKQGNLAKISPLIPFPSTQPHKYFCRHKEWLEVLLNHSKLVSIMTLNLQSKPDLFSSQSVLLLSMSQIWQVRNYLQFNIWGCQIHKIPSNKLLEQRDRVQSTQEARAEIILLPLTAFKVKSLYCPAPPLLAPRVIPQGRLPAAVPGIGHCGVLQRTG